jgi:hypothetical protein
MPIKVHEHYNTTGANKMNSTHSAVLYQKLEDLEYSCVRISHAIVKTIVDTCLAIEMKYSMTVDV